MSVSVKRSIDSQGGARRVLRVWGILAFGLPLVTYLRTLCPTIYVGDSGELVAGAFHLGIVHPPGYPLYCLIGRLFALLPVGVIARRLNFFSALCAAFSAWLVFLLVRGLLTGMRRQEPAGPRLDTLLAGASALLAGLLCAYSRTLWTQAVIAEVYALNLLFLLLCTMALLRWQRSGEGRFAVLFAFVYGLSVSHHPGALLAAPAFLFFLIRYRHRLFESRRTLLCMLGLLIAGLTPYLYLPLRAMNRPLLDWGHPVGAGDLLAHVTRATYGNLSKHPRSAALLIGQLKAWVVLLVRQLGWGWVFVSLGGLVFLFRRKWEWGIFTLVLFGTTGLGIIGLLNFQFSQRELYLVRVFFIPGFAVMTLWLGLGVAGAAERLLAWTGRAGKGRAAARPLGWVLVCLIPLLAVVPLQRNFAAGDHSREAAAARLGRDLLTTTETGAILFTGRDTPTFALAHARLVEGLRPDISLRHTGSGDIFRWLMPSPVPVDPRRRPLYGTLPGELPEIAGWSPQGVGLLFQLRQEPIATDRLLEIWENYPRECPDSRRLEDDFFLRELHRNRVAARANLARELIRREELDQALQQTRTAVEMDSAFFGSDRSLSPVWARLYNDLGLALKKGGRDRKAERAYRRAIEMDDRFPDPLRNLGVLNAYRLDRPLEAIGLWERYLELRPGDPEADAIRAEIGRLQNSVNHGYTVDEETSTGERNP